MLISLTVLCTLNFVDGVLIQILAQPIIEEFKLQDWQFGLLSGFGFVFIYTSAGGLRRAILVTVTIFAVAGLIYLMTCKTLQRDLVAKLS